MITFYALMLGTGIAKIAVVFTGYLTTLLSDAVAEGICGIT